LYTPQASFYRRAASLLDQGRNIDAASGSMHSITSTFSLCHASERLLGAQRGQGALQAAQVEGLFVRHGSLARRIIASSCA
jgi:hypothetical protein